MSIAYPPVVGSLLLFTVGIITIPDVLFVWSVIWNATLTLVAVVFLCLILDQINFFRYFAISVAKFSKGNPRRLFLLVLLLSSAITALFSNDGSILVMTPIIYSILREVNVDGKTTVAFLIAVGFVCDSTSLPFSISNLVNIISTEYFAVPFLEYAGTMLFPYLVATVSSIAILYLVFRKHLIGELEIKNLPEPGSVVKDSLALHVSILLVVGLIISYSIAGLFLFPISLIALPTVLGFFLFIRSRVDIEPGKLLKYTPWSVIFFSLGMFLIVNALSINGLTTFLGHAISVLYSLPGPLNFIAISFLFSMTASLMNNLPSVISGNLALGSMHLQQLFYLNVLANDVGTKFTPIGSLATLLWFHFLKEKREVNISYAYFCKVGMLVTPPVIVFSAIALWAVFLI